MQDIMTAIIRNRNLLNKQFLAVERELDYLYLEGDPVAIQEELVLIARELVKTSFINCTPHHLTIGGLGNFHRLESYQGFQRSTATPSQSMV